MDEFNMSEQLYEGLNIVLQALEFNASCIVASYNTNDADREACLQHVWDTYDLYYNELDVLFEDDEESEDEEWEEDEEE